MPILKNIQPPSQYVDITNTVSNQNDRLVLSCEYPPGHETIYTVNGINLKSVMCISLKKHDSNVICTVHEKTRSSKNIYNNSHDQRFFEENFNNPVVSILKYGKPKCIVTHICTDIILDDVSALHKQLTELMHMHLQH